jgi:hypothetical protein
MGVGQIGLLDITNMPLEQSTIRGIITARRTWPTPNGKDTTMQVRMKFTTPGFEGWSGWWYASTIKTTQLRVVK